jgi:EAL domain-containing protein (putative c-di-GMP-specific phosphodiesterase class I)
LVRWYHPEWGDLPPEEFVPMAEKTGLINALTFWVIEAAFKCTKEWRKMGCHLKISVNISADNLHDPRLLSELRSRLPRLGIPADELVLEITESVVMEDPEYALGVLHEIAEMGITLSIDDYGTGFSSLSYLKQYPVKELKIDKSFVLNMAEDKEDAIIVHSTIELAHNLGLTVVAEGVESEAILHKLKEFGCDIAQGYYISRPLPVEKFLKWRKTCPWGLPR